MSETNDDEPGAGGEGIDGVRAAGAKSKSAPDMRNKRTAGDAYDVEDLGQDCPVQPLGFLLQKQYFLDWAGQLIELDTRFQKGELMALFGTQIGWLDNKWPKWKPKPGTGKKGEPPEWIFDDFDQADAQRALLGACAKAGLFNPRGKVRGRGAHRGDHGELILHCGDEVVVAGAISGLRRPTAPKGHKPGLVTGYVYPRAEKLPVPGKRALMAAHAVELLETLDTWNWRDQTRVEIEIGDERKRVGLASYLLLCWIAAATLGGALHHRPHVWITGPSGSGKTTLQQLIRDLMDQWGVSTEDATEAGVRQLLDQDTLPVMFDEIEPDAENESAHTKIVILARLSYSGSQSVRGTSEHKAKQFVAKSCFLFSSIHHHELPQADRNRLAVLHLDAFEIGTPPLEPPDGMRDLGAALRRRLVDQWHRLDATYEVYAREMLRQGYSGREQNTYGTLLAAGDLLLYDATPDPQAMHETNRAAELVRALHHLIDKARAEAESTVERCVRRLASQRLPAKSGEDQQNVGRWIEIALVEAIANPDDKRARAKLRSHGMRLVNLEADHAKGQGGLLDLFQLKGGYLAVASKSNHGMAEIFANSDWKKGVWSQALSGVSGAITNKKSRYGGPPEQCVLVPIGEIVDVGSVEKEAEGVAKGLFNPPAP
jgi:hypothetical protein